ncbi:transmembrane protein, putative [Bodo saltans]|uniref:Transmembrane protein, putative n=1 Tax=Bodo saltans TaxID=75058 RepID=A0A0S4IIX2_BODSA|nr:transmembrane protein, putative [Bodo saltans]|eukprot:CUE73440.1 transmembrane protein, putative [Bodo saltans]
MSTTVVNMTIQHNLVRQAHVSEKNHHRKDTATLSVCLFAITVGILTIMPAVVRSDSADPRCADYTCDLTNTDPSNYYDPSECDSDTCNSTCLTGFPEYEALLEELGVGTALRSSQPLYLPQTSWLSSQFPNQIFKILAMELLGYKNRSAYMPDGWSILCCDPTVMWLEHWPTDPFPTDLQGTFISLPNGYVGFANLYIPNYVMSQHKLASAYAAYELLAEYKTLMLPASSVPCNETKIDPAGACVDSNRYCSDSIAYWPNTTCVDGRYVPPQCVNNSDCQEIIYGSSTWDPGFFESVIKNNHIRFVNMGPRLL